MEEDGERGREREKENTLLPFVLYKSEVVFLSRRLTLFPHTLSGITLMSGKKK